MGLIDRKIPLKRPPKKLQTRNIPTKMWKILTSQIRKEIYDSLKSRGLFPEEQKVNRKGLRGTGKLLYIHQHILNESKTGWKNLDIAWIDKEMACDMVPQSWIINCPKMYKISHEFINVIEKTMKIWTVELTAGGKDLAEKKIQRGIFHGDVLSPLLLRIGMVPLYHILRKCTTGHKLSKSQEMINHLMYMGDIKLFVKNAKE